MAKKEQFATMHVYPNPTTDFIKIKPIQDTELFVTIYDSNGRLLIQSSESKINIQGFAPGIYLAQVENRKTSKVQTVRFVKQ